jgi:hypothetical protein
VSYETAWSGDWHGRILERVRLLGYETVTEYAADRVGIWLVSLAHELGPGDIAGAQIQALLVEEAIRTDTIPRLLRDLFVRELRHRLPQGWSYPLAAASRSGVAGAYAGWWAELQDHLDHEASTAAAKDLLDAELSPGWLPDGPDDPVIIAFVDRCLGRAPS